MNELISKDKKLIWHPYTQEKTAPMPILISKAKDEYIYDSNDNQYIDLISSWWVNIHGHANEEIAEAIYKQAKTLEHVIFTNFTHEPALTMCENLTNVLPQQFCRFFFSDNGSTATEVAMKMALQYWINDNKKKDLFLSFQGNYHGDTAGAMSSGLSSGFFDNYKKFLFDCKFIPFPNTWLGDQKVIEKENESLHILEQVLQCNKVAGFIIEPLIQGAGGMKMCRPEYLEQVVRLLKKHEVIVIFDEVMTGFYRTGKMFAMNYLDVKPDIICLSKGITGGFLPLALTVTTNPIYEKFLGDDFSKALVHGHSYTANPLGCAAAIASLNILTSKGYEKKIADIEKNHKNFLEQLSSPKLSKIVKSPRMMGTIVAFNLFTEESNYCHPANSELKSTFLKRGLLIRPLGNTIYLIPPYCITEKALHYSYKQIIEVLEQLS